MSSLLEVCVDSYASAMSAIKGGADRLELCSSLALGGLTPSPALLKQIKAKTDIPVRCLIRKCQITDVLTYKKTRPKPCCIIN